MTASAADARPVLTAAGIASAIGGPAPTAEQAAVVEAPLRPLLVVAGAGSGKTETMAARVVWLVANGHVQPDQVLGLTFTRKAATELAERVARRLRLLRHKGLWTPSPEDGGAEVLGGTPTISTYHAYAGRLVREHGLRLGYEPESRLLSEAAAWQYASEVVQGYDGPMGAVGYEARTVTNAVVDLAGELAEHLRAPAEVATLLDRVFDLVDALPRGKGGVADLTRTVRALKARRAVLPLVQRFLDLKRSRDSLDFADQVAVAASLAQRFPDIGLIERQRFQAVLLDEFQDTSEAQLVLLRQLFAPVGGGSFPVTAVGDPHQSIYGWRGASATTLARFPAEFPDRDGAAAVLPLSTSWRNDHAVLELANVTAAPLRAATTVPVAPLRTRADALPGRVAAGRYPTAEEEAQAVAAWVRQQWYHPPDGSVPGPATERHTGVSAAVLCRKRSQFAPVVAALEAAGLPVEVVGLGGLLLTPEVADVVALLWVVQDPTRGDQLMRLLTAPSVQLGAADLEGLAGWARQLARAERPGPASAPADQAVDSAESASIVEALDRPPPEGWVGPGGCRLSPAARARLTRLRTVVRALRSMTGLALADLVGEAERALGLDVEVLARPEHTPTTARAHLDAFGDVAADFSSTADRPTLGGFLDWLDAALQEERGLDRGPIEVSDAAVQVMTVHAAKGLEWDLVAVPGLVEGGFPARATGGGVTSSDRSGAWAVPPPMDRGWLGGLDGLPYPLRRDADGLPAWRFESCLDQVALAKEVAAFTAEGGAHQVMEERRLAYVAFTRARAGLLLTAPVWTDASTPRVTSPFLLELLGEEPEGLVADGWGPRRVVVLAWAAMPPVGVAAVNPRDALPRAVAWPADLGAGRRQQLQAATALVARAIEQGNDAGRLGPPTAPTLPGLHRTDVDELSTELDLLLRERTRAAQRSQLRVALPRHLSASELVGLAQDPAEFALRLRRPMPQAPAPSARRGTAFHAWVEQFYARAALVDLDELPGSADTDPADDADLPMMQAAFRASPWATQVPLEVELPIETVVDGVAVRGRIDAVFARPAAAGGGYVVVDWKTGEAPTGRRADAQALQLAAYALAYARLRALPDDQVTAAFYYARTGRTVYPPLAGLSGLTALLAAVPQPT